MNNKVEIKEKDLENVGGGLIPPYPPSAKAESPFHSTFDGNSKTVNLNIEPDKTTVTSKNTENIK